MFPKFGLLLMYAGTLLAVGGAFTGSKEILAGAVFLVGVGYFVRDYTDDSVRVLTPMSVYMLAASTWFGLANLVAYWAYDSRLSFLFVEWRVDQYLTQAQLVAAVGGVFAPLVGYTLASRLCRLGFRPIPVGFDVPVNSLFAVGWAFLVLAWGIRLTGLRLSGLGMVSALIVGGVNFALFLFTMHSRSISPNRRTAWVVLIGVILVAETSYQLAYSYLRTDAMLPLAAVLIPSLYEKRVGLRGLIGIAATITAFMLIMEPFAELRGARVSGGERLQRLFTESSMDGDALEIGAVSVMSRLSTCSQLSQIGRLVHENGYFDGETMSYVVYAFVPRAIWPNKPRIAPGQWFAQRIGRGSVMLDGSFSNAINMTIPGEFFLNFGWLGTVLGCMAYGALLALGWAAARVSPQCRNPIALVYAFTLFAQVSGTGAHVGYVFNIVFWYLLALALTLAVGWFIRRPHQLRLPSSEAALAERAAGTGSIAIPAARTHAK